MSPLDTRIPAVLLRIDRNPFHHGTLGAVRSLGRAGVQVHLVADDRESPVRRSRYLHRMHQPPAPGSPPAEVAAALRRVTRHLTAPAVLIPLDDAGALAVSALYAELSDRFLLPRPTGDTAERVADKASLARVCARAGVAHPTTVVPESAADAVGAVARLGLPAVAKWSRPWLLPHHTGLRSTTLIGSPHEAAALFERRDEAGSRLLLQAFVPGARDGDWFVHGCAGRDGVVRGGGTGRKHRSWPRSAGLTVSGTWTENRELWSAATRLITSLGYRGVFDLDFRRDAATGDFHLIDFNPRPGAQFRLFADGTGTDVVRALHLDLTHRPVPAPHPLEGRAYVVENYAPLTALRALALPGPREPSPPGELAWHAGDDPGPGAAMRRLWLRHVTRRLCDAVVRRSRRVLALFSFRSGPRELAPAVVPGQKKRADRPESVPSPTREPR
ncbi:ATP-grasp domain-containing protein [Streptomyces sp. WAC 01529]|uniref:carboxylate--amine ligase n=1 Tax=Streptomyces sp. WAC 01529 TaxID=2203205 RepID=UPI000F70A873|nr:ATP-grasp domain-containing protein [Streptomyces sp. WAC 01529]AZM54521.1 ATP-grasp domain-containing protein [Streptomyces sp. WAC 01529]